MDKKFVGIFHSIDTVLYKVVELRNQGYRESDMYAFSSEQDNISMLQGQTELNLVGSYGERWVEGFNKMLGIDESVHNAFIEMGFSKDESAHYYDEVENGGVVIFVDNESRNLSNEADSSAELGLSGEMLDGQNENQQFLESDGISPRLNTKKL